MKIKTLNKTYQEVSALVPKKAQKPKKPSLFFRTLLKLVSLPDVLATRFSYRKIGMERLGKKEPCFYLMNHSSFVDLEAAVTMIYPRPVNIIATTDAFVGKNWLMRHLGCFPTQKFVSNIGTFFDVKLCLGKLKSSVLMFPEAGYSFDGTATVLPDNLGSLLKKLGVPLVMIRTYGAFSRDPLYNNLQRRKVRVSAEMEYLLSPDEIAEKSEAELQAIIEAQFTFDNFRWQKENGVKISEPFRADMLHRVLYKCPHCLSEGKMEGRGVHLSCHACGKTYTLSEYGELIAEEGESAFSFVPDWYAWERQEVRRELDAGSYKMDVPVKIAMLIDTKALYFVGEGRLTHKESEGFHLSGCDGALDYIQKPHSTYTLNADYNWYEIGDVIGIGDNKALYYCFPQKDTYLVTKARLATEEIYKRIKESKEKEAK